MIKKMAFMLLGLTVLFGALIGWRMFVNSMIKKALSHPMSPVVISTMEVKPQDWQAYVTSMGSLVAQQNVNIMPQVPGIVTKIYFQSGDVVKQGDPLVNLDNKVEVARLAKDQTQLKLTESNFRRAKRLYASRVMARADYDNASAQFDAAKAAVVQDQVLISQKYITAPFNGKLGIRQINLGQYLTLGGTPIVNLQMLDPIEVEFALTQQDFKNIKIGASMIFSVDAYPDREFTGTVMATNAGFDSTTRMLLVRAKIPNPKLELYSGMYGTVKVLLPLVKGVIVVPQTAVEYNLYGSMMYIVKHDKSRAIVKQIFVTTGQRRGDQIVIEKGLQSGDEVVTVGQVKLFDGAPVIVKNDEPTSLKKK